MRVRKRDANGDFVFGQGVADYIGDIEAVRQIIQTRLQLLRNSFWRDLSDGLPLMQSILESPGSAANLNAVTGIIQSRIAGTPGVSDILSVSASFDPITRAYSFLATVQTQFSVTPLSVPGVL